VSAKGFPWGGGGKKIEKKTERKEKYQNKLGGRETGPDEKAFPGKGDISSRNFVKKDRRKQQKLLEGNSSKNS